MSLLNLSEDIKELEVRQVAIDTIATILNSLAQSKKDSITREELIEIQRRQIERYNKKAQEVEFKISLK